MTNGMCLDSWPLVYERKSARWPESFVYVVELAVLMWSIALLCPMF